MARWNKVRRHAQAAQPGIWVAAVVSALISASSAIVARRVPEVKPVCQPGAQDECFLYGPTRGIYLCAADGQGWGACEAIEPAPSLAPPITLARRQHMRASASGRRTTRQRSGCRLGASATRTQAHRVSVGFQFRHPAAKSSSGSRVGPCRFGPHPGHARQTASAYLKLPKLRGGLRVRPRKPLNAASARPSIELLPGESHPVRRVGSPELLPILGASRRNRLPIAPLSLHGDRSHSRPLGLSRIPTSTRPTDAPWEERGAAPCKLARLLHRQSAASLLQ